MKGKFSRLSEVLSGLIDLIFAGLLWLLCSLPVLTLGASTTALYYTVMKCIRHNRGRVAPTFFHGFRSNFRTATLIWLLFLLWFGIGAADAYAFGRMGYGPGTVLYSLSRLFFVPPLLFFPWVFAYISRHAEVHRLADPALFRSQRPAGGRAGGLPADLLAAASDFPPSARCGLSPHEPDDRTCLPSFPAGNR